MARALAAGHQISDSDSDREDASTSLIKKSSFVSEHTLSDSDSDATYIEEEERNANNSHPRKRKAKKRRYSTDSDSDATDIEENNSDKQPSSSGRTRIEEKKSILSSATKRLKRDDTEIVDEGECSTSLGSANKPVCPHGAKCYRKNPSHLAEYDHPGNPTSEKWNQGIFHNLTTVPS